MDDQEQMWELKRLSANLEEKIDYWLMAVEAAAIGFAVQQTRDSTMRFTMVPLALAVLVWGCAFYAGYRRQRVLSKSLAANYDFIQRHGQDDFERTQSLRKAANRWGAWQFPCFMFGAILYLVWHVLEMACRTQPVG